MSVSDRVSTSMARERAMALSMSVSVFVYCSGMIHRKNFGFEGTRNERKRERETEVL